MRTWIAVVLLVGPAVVGCGEDDVSFADRAATTYDGSLVPGADVLRHPRAGVAGNVVDCDTWGTGSAFEGDVYDEGATAGDPEGAVRHAFSEGLWLTLPDDLAEAARAEDRVLYVAEVDGRAKVAVVVHDGAGTAGAGGDGWYVESWARCDVVELPPDFVEERGYQVWHDAEGRVVPTTELEAQAGPEHCDWQDMTFLHLAGDGRDATFARDPHRDVRDSFAEPYLAHTTLPPDAVDTGYRRGEDRMWIAPGDARVYVGEGPDDVELWPRMVEPLGCE
ncbi:hypothetical protein [Nocardioides marmotae]|uniref:hypothetical protein n=1 Tax=Nocardioides marmotae TaxID=2663857 RepID=UPI0012B5F8B9|nr:hypothetical protein [Nocardioides marmotae]MBC9735107.1 hypothetical protein [Nocardioides marmotae]MTB86207.1 hypothetical protein [Nocardioides marmotae]